MRLSPYLRRRSPLNLLYLAQMYIAVNLAVSDPTYLLVTALWPAHSHRQPTPVSASRRAPSTMHLQHTQPL